MLWCGVHHGRRDRKSMKGKGRDGRNSTTAQGWSHRSRTVREVGWEGQEKMCAVAGQRECEGERKGREELRHGAGTVPQVPHRQGSGMGGTGKDVCCGVRCIMIE